LLEDIAFGNKSCTFTLEFTSTVKLYSELGWWRAAVRTAAPVPLQLYYEDGRPVLRSKGNGTVEYLTYEDKTGKCSPATVKQYPTVDIRVARVFPVFRDGRLVDFILQSLEFPGRSTQVKLDVTRDKKGCEKTLVFSGGGDLWSGAFVLFRYSRGDIDGWTSPTGSFSYAGAPLIVTREFKDATIDVPGDQKLTENGIYRITIQRASK